jgi:hypothetical protein
MQYGLIFGGNSSHIATIFEQKNILSIITGCRSTDSFEIYLRTEKFFLFTDNITSLICGKQQKSQILMSITHSRQKFNFHQPSTNLPIHQKGANSTDIQILSHRVSKI